MKVKAGTNSGPDLLISLDGRHRRAQLENRLRELVRDGTLSAGERLPASRELAAELGVSRRLVVDAFAQLIAEGYLIARQGAGTFAAGSPSGVKRPPEQPSPSAPRYDFFPGVPDLATFPRTLYARALREVLREAPASSFGYPDIRGVPALRDALAGYLRRVRGVACEPQQIVICSGATQALALLARALLRLGTRSIAVEDPGLPAHRALLSYAGLKLQGARVDEHGLDISCIRAPVVLATPAHQCPTGVVLSPTRRSAVVAWAQSGGLLIEDDYDAELRFDGQPLAALQGLVPDRVVYLGTASKALSPALRLGWMVLPARLIDAVLEAKLCDDLGSPVIEQMALARLLETAAYDRHLRTARRRYRQRRVALIAAVEQHLPGARVSGIAAGLHALLRLPAPADALRLVEVAEKHSLRVYPLSTHMLQPPPFTDALVLGYGGLSEPAISEGVRRLAEALDALG